MVTLGADGVVAVHASGSRIEVADGKVKITGTDAVQVVAQELSLAAGAISLGGSASEPAVLGQGLMTLFNAHTHPTAVGPSGPPVPPLTPGPPAFSLSVKVQ